MRRIDADLYLVPVSGRKAELVRAALVLAGPLAPPEDRDELAEAVALFTQAQPVDALPCPHSYRRADDGEVRCSRCHVAWADTDDRPPTARQEVPSR